MDRLVATLMLAAWLSACAAAGTSLEPLRRNPAEQAGRIFHLTIYPHDTVESSGFTVACFEPCDAEDANRHGIGIRFLDRSSIQGLRGRTPVRVSARFDARCYDENGDFMLLVCPIRAWYFEEVRSGS